MPGGGPNSSHPSSSVPVAFLGPGADEVLRAVDPDDLALGPDQAPERHAGVPEPAADVEHARAGLRPVAAKQLRAVLPEPVAGPMRTDRAEGVPET